MSTLNLTKANIKKTFLLMVCMISVSYFCTAEKVSLQRQKLISYCLKFMGKPYVLGATGPDSFDCSGFVFYTARKSLGIQMPRTAEAIYNYSKVEHISPTVREPGDLVFFKSLETGRINHVGIYVGKRKFIHAASDGPHTGIIISKLDEKYWKTHYAGSGRFLPTTKEAKLVANSAGE